jgi:hypothetical protein
VAQETRERGALTRKQEAATRELGAQTGRARRAADWSSARAEDREGARPWQAQGRTGLNLSWRNEEERLGELEEQMRTLGGGRKQRAWARGEPGSRHAMAGTRGATGRWGWREMNGGSRVSGAENIPRRG